ncbi:MAG: hypothetical protein ACJ70S_04610 [Nitrososphaera sp.]
MEFGLALKILEEYIEIPKQELLFAMAECKPESATRIQEIITIKER